jgi:hypothetical protein
VHWGRRHDQFGLRKLRNSLRSLRISRSPYHTRSSLLQFAELDRHNSPVARGADLTPALPSARVLRERREERLWVGGEEPPGGWGGHGSGGHGVPSVRSRGGVSVTRLFADTEGPYPGPHCWVVAGGVSPRRERGRASAERPLTHRAKQKPHAVKRDELAPGPRRKKEESLHAVEQGKPIAPAAERATSLARGGSRGRSSKTWSPRNRHGW